MDATTALRRRIPTIHSDCRPACPGAGSALLRQAGEAHRQPGRAAADCPPGDRRFGAVRDLARAAARHSGAGPGMPRVQLQRDRIRDFCGL
jgi:hypothetical protein